MRRSRLMGLALLGAISIGSAAGAADAPDWMQCRRAIDGAQRAVKVPKQLLAAIGRVETGRWDPQTGTVEPWPWSINSEGEDFVFETKAQAIAAVRALQARGRTSIDVGCMQVNLMYHPDAFASLDEAFDPPANALYAARFLTRLFQQTNDWTQAAALYHSATPQLGDDYRRRVLAVWPDEARRQAALVQAAVERDNLSAAWAATLPGKGGSAKRPASFGLSVSTRRPGDAPAGRPKHALLDLAAD